METSNTADMQRGGNILTEKTVRYLLVICEQKDPFVILAASFEGAVTIS